MVIHDGGGGQNLGHVSVERAGGGRETEGKSKGTSEPEKREMSAACGNKAIITPSSVSEATMESPLTGLESLLHL